MVNDEILIGFIGFIGGIVGAIITNSIIRWLEKKSEKKEQVSKYKEEIKDILDEFCNIWDNYQVTIYSHSDAIIEMKTQINILSRELTKKTSKQYIQFLTNNVIGELHELRTSLIDTIPYINEEKINSGLIESKFNEMCDKAINIKNELDNNQFKI